LPRLCAIGIIRIRFIWHNRGGHLVTELPSLQQCDRTAPAPSTEVPRDSYASGGSGAWGLACRSHGGRCTNALAFYRTKPSCVASCTREFARDDRESEWSADGGSYRGSGGSRGCSRCKIKCFAYCRNVDSWCHADTTYVLKPMRCQWRLILHSAQHVDHPCAEQSTESTVPRTS